MRIDLGFDGGELLALDGTVVAEVEPQTLGRHDRSRLAHMRTQDSPERRMDEMRGGVIALDIAAPRFVDLGEGGRRLERLAKRADHRVPAVHLLDAFDRQLPPVTLDHTGVADLAAGLRVERILFENDLELITGLTERDRLRLGFGGIVPDPLLLALLL